MLAGHRIYFGVWGGRGGRSTPTVASAGPSHYPMGPSTYKVHTQMPPKSKDIGTTLRPSDMYP